MPDCKFCQKSFTTAYSLKRHKNTTKKCLDIRGERSEEQCEYCQKFFSKCGISRHYNNCLSFKIHEKTYQYKNTIEQQQQQLVKQKELIELYELKIQTLQDKLENIAIQAVNRPTTTHTITHNTNHNTTNKINKTQINTYIKALTPITEDHLKQYIPKLTIDHLNNGADGYINFLVNYPLKNSIFVTDVNRCNIKYKDKNNNIISDAGMTNLMIRLCGVFNGKSEKLLKEYYKETRCAFNSLLVKQRERMNEIEEDTRIDDDSRENQLNSEHKEFCSLNNACFDALRKIQYQRSDLRSISEGDKPEIYYRIVKGVCQRLYGQSEDNQQRAIEQIESDMNRLESTMNTI